MTFDKSRMTLPARIVALQAGVLVVLASGWSLSGVGRGVSSALAGFAVIAPNAYLAWRISANNEKIAALDQARQVIGNSVAKLALGAGLLVGTFVLYQPDPLAFFVTLIVVHAVHWIAPWLEGPPRTKSLRRT